ncbi:PREDICTED: uncharacterized protein LOC109483194 [Branchiostoma belcheri]|uniref:Uncharacterized protein LOC109483194 n=1 Tax=Branchiostoma belcheri TaxID=7741 RepID=A0A6P5AEQ6_BRABE|nr:PREDICTED: uncharacterized protein LOC109483194 [Branchiostoma belcheri]
MVVFLANSNNLDTASQKTGPYRIEPDPTGANTLRSGNVHTSDFKISGTEPTVLVPGQPVNVSFEFTITNSNGTADVRPNPSGQPNFLPTIVLSDSSQLENATLRSRRETDQVPVEVALDSSSQGRLQDGLPAGQSITLRGSALFTIPKYRCADYTHFCVNVDPASTSTYQDKDVNNGDLCTSFGNATSTSDVKIDCTLYDLKPENWIVNSRESDILSVDSGTDLPMSFDVTNLPGGGNLPANTRDNYVPVLYFSDNAQLEDATKLSPPVPLQLFAANRTNLKNALPIDDKHEFLQASGNVTLPREDCSSYTHLCLFVAERNYPEKDVNNNDICRPLGSHDGAVVRAACPARVTPWWVWLVVVLCVLFLLLLLLCLCCWLCGAGRKKKKDQDISLYSLTYIDNTAGFVPYTYNPVTSRPGRLPVNQPVVMKFQQYNLPRGWDHAHESVNRMNNVPLAAEGPPKVGKSGVETMISKVAGKRKSVNLVKYGVLPQNLNNQRDRNNQQQRNNPAGRNNPPGRNNQPERNNPAGRGGTTVSVDFR